MTDLHIQGGKATDEETEISQQIYTDYLRAACGMYALLRTSFSVRGGSGRKWN